MKRFTTYKTNTEVVVDENFWLANPHLGVASLMGGGALMRLWFPDGPPADEDQWMPVAIEEAETVILKLVELDELPFNIPAIESDDE